MAEKRKELRLYAAAFLVPCGVLLCCFALLGIAPFGDHTVLLYDSSIQYLDFAGYLRTVFAGGNDLFYTFSKNLGGEMVSLFAYYLMSPFSILFAFATRQSVPLVFTAVVVLKMAACGLTFFYAGAKRFGCKWQHLIFSTSYALMAYNVMYGWNIMWMDGVLVLPLMALGLERLWKGESARMYALSLAYALMTNFYIGYMLCIAAVLLSAALMAAENASGREKGKRFGKFVFASCIGGFASAFLWLPTFLSMLGGRAEAVSTTFVWSRTYNILGLAGKLVAGSASENQFILGTPHIFCGILALMLAAVFFLRGKSALKHRLIPVAVLAVIAGSSAIRALDVVWHGFSPNNALNFRYAFIISYVILVMAQYAWEQRREIPKAWFAAAGGLVILMIAGLLVMRRVMGLDFISPAGLAVSGAVVLVAVPCLMAEEKRPFASIVLAAVCLLELGINYGICMTVAKESTPMLRMESYSDYVRKTEQAVEAVKDRDTGFYRMEKTFRRNKNDAMLLSYNGLTHFSSSQEKAVPRYMKKLGMTTYQDVWSEYSADVNGAVDSLLGVKYLLSRTDSPLAKGCRLADTVGDIGIYENPNALPIAMAAHRDILTVSGQDNSFTLQNRLWQGLTGDKTASPMVPEDWTVRLENLTEAEPGVYAKADPRAPAAMHLDVTVSRDMPLYCYFSAPNEQNVRLQVNGADAGAYFDQYRWNTVKLGSFPVGQTVTVSLVPGAETMQLDGVWFAYEELQTLSTLVQIVKTSPVELQRDTSSHLTGSYTLEDDRVLLFTIPYDTGWHLTVDGAPVPVIQAAGLFLAAEAPAGSHSFELRYIPSGSMEGLAISLAAVLTGTAWIYLKKKRS